MKDTVESTKTRARMAAGLITAEGFLGDDSRPVTQIIAADEEEFRSLGLDIDHVADLLERLRDAGDAGLGEPVTVEDRWLVQSGDARGRLPCPFGDGFHRKNPVSLSRIGLDQSLSYSDLSIHMLRAHHFCQGRGSTFRLEPSLLQRILG